MFNTRKIAHIFDSRQTQTGTDYHRPTDTYMDIDGHTDAERTETNVREEVRVCVCA